VDAAGNIEGAQSGTFSLDTAAPVTTPSLAGGVFGSTQTVTLTCDDGAGTGCANTFYTTDPEAAAADFLPYTSALNVSATAVLRFYSTDSAGNQEAVLEETYVIDADGPAVTASPEAGWIASYYVYISLTCDDGAGVGCDTIYYTTDGTDPTPSSTAFTPATDLVYVYDATEVRFSATDLLGNAGPIGSVTYTPDFDAPWVSYTLSNGEVFSSSTDFSLTCTDSTSGCDVLRYTLDGTSPSLTSGIDYMGPVTVVREWTWDAARLFGAGAVPARSRRRCSDGTRHRTATWRPTRWASGWLRPRAHR